MDDEPEALFIIDASGYFGIPASKVADIMPHLIRVEGKWEIGRINYSVSDSAISVTYVSKDEVIAMHVAHKLKDKK